MSNGQKSDYEPPAAVGMIKLFAWLTIFGSAIIIFSSIQTGFLGLATGLGGLVSAVCMFGFARLIESADRIQKDVAALRAKTESQSPN